ncbi:group-specific protein [Bacillus sp. D-CC]
MFFLCIQSADVLGELEVVQAILVAQPEALRASGPHGISLLQHARMGGENIHSSTLF